MTHTHLCTGTQLCVHISAVTIAHLSISPLVQTDQTGAGVDSVMVGLEVPPPMGQGGRGRLGVRLGRK